MDHLFRGKPLYLQVVEKQRLAARALTTKRSEPELAHCRRTLEPVAITDVELPRLPLVRPKGGGDHYYLLGEAAQVPGKLLLLAVDTGSIRGDLTADQMELVPPTS